MEHNFIIINEMSIETIKMKQNWFYCLFSFQKEKINVMEFRTLEKPPEKPN